MPRAKTASIATIEVALDGPDVAWLKDKGYPFGVDAAGYLRMMVRQARLAPEPTMRDQRSAFPGHNPLIVTQPPRVFIGRPAVYDGPQPPLLEAMEGEAGPQGGEVDIESFTDGVVGQAEEAGAIAPAEAGPGGDVVLIGPRRNRPAKEWA